MQEIADWLEKRSGPSQYTAHFAENHIDFSILRDLTDQDLENSVSSWVITRKMLRAIGGLDAALPTALATSTGPVSQDAPSAAKSR